MFVYGIRHKPTGNFMPVPSGRNRSGSSYWEPFENSNELPRLFSAKLNARVALAQWLRGQHKPIDSIERDELSGKAYLIRGSVEVIAVASRKAEDMEIVEFTVAETGVIF